MRVLHAHTHTHTHSYTHTSAHIGRRSFINTYAVYAAHTQTQMMVEREGAELKNLSLPELP